MTVATSTPEETRRVARDLAARLRLGDVLLLSGDLGTGKTTFVQGLADGLSARTPVTSPSFILVHEYPLPHKGVFRHLDVYRLNDPAVDLDRIGLPELLSDPNAMTVIEWADRLPSPPTVPGRVFAIRFEHGKTEQERRIVLPEVPE